MGSTIAGIDFGAKRAGTTVICRVVGDELEVAQCEKGQDADAWLHQMLHTWQPGQVFIDAPLSLPAACKNPEAGDSFFYRACDVELKAMSPMFLGGLTARAMKLKWEFAGVIEFYETYPKAQLQQLNLTEPGYKKDRAALPELSHRLLKALPVGNTGEIRNWHCFDAVLALVGGVRYQRGEAHCYGNTGEGLVWV